MSGGLRGQETLQAHGPGMAQDLGGAALIQKNHEAGHVAGKVHHVRGDDHGAAFLGQAAHDVQHLAHQFGVQRAGRFIEQHHLGLDRQGPGNGDTLLFALRRKSRISVLPVPHARARQMMIGALARLGAGQAVDADRTQHDLVARPCGITG